ncbi:MAG: cytochrome c oxidase subunit II, partial [Chloroflexota bacterium]|nr:cytochrome c oxidase subunit II [Chloroflexota bacterium]
TGQRIVLLCVTAATVAGCLPTPATTQAQQIAWLYTVFLAGAAVVAATVWLLATWAVVRYRRRRAPEELPEQVRGSVRLEALWTILPSLAVLGLFVATIIVLGQVQARQEGSVNVRVTAFRWGWQFQLPDEQVTVSGVTGQTPELVVPVREPIHVTLTSVDVVHAFYVPAFLYNHDANPGSDATFDLTITAPGSYGGQCAEFCGTFHSRMPFTIRGADRAEFERWVAAQRARGQAQ